MANVLWLQGGACSGNTMSFLCAEEPTVTDLVTDFGINILWHPSIGIEMGDEVGDLMRDCISGKTPLDIFVFEGSVVQGPGKKGTMNIFAERPMQDWVRELASVAGFVVAVGDCAAWGGIPATAPNPTDSTGLQFHKAKGGGFLGSNFRSKAGLPVINIPGCPAHPDWISQVLVAVATGRAKDLLLDGKQRPATFFTSMTQSGCVHTASFAQKIDGHFGQRGGCLFYTVGCRGPMTRSTCNRILWNRVSSKSRVNHPCIGCTEPEFPHHDLAKGTVFKTPKHFGLLPKEVPHGEGKLTYYFRAGLEKLVLPYNRTLKETTK